MRDRALEHIADDFHIPVAVRAEALPAPDAILVDDAQRAEVDVLRIMIIGKRKLWYESSQPWLT